MLPATPTPLRDSPITGDVQCALELLSWFVIVKKTRALSDEGYGQLSSASEKLGLALTLLGIPRRIPPGLKKIVAFQKEWKDIADAVVQARNYLVHPTQSRSGKRKPKKEYPWPELWIAGQWLLELVILRLLEYSGDYRNGSVAKIFEQGCKGASVPERFEAG